MPPHSCTSAYSAAADTDHREDGMSHPTFTTRPMPRARAASSTPSTGSPSMSMCVCASKPPGSGRAAASRGDDPPGEYSNFALASKQFPWWNAKLEYSYPPVPPSESAEPEGEGMLSFGLLIFLFREPGDFLVNHGLVQLGEQRYAVGKRRAGRHRTGLPAERRVVVAGDDRVGGGALLGHGLDPRHA